MAVQYNKSSIVISSPNKDNKNLLVYAHPGDKITFDFDISALKKEILNGDLVIHLLTGNTVTLVNFGLMSLDNKAPTIDDTSKSYSSFSLFGGAGYYDDSGVGSYVVSRQLSSPDAKSLPSGDEMPTAKELASGEGSETRQVGNFFTPEQNVVPEFGPLFREYVSKTLQHANVKTYEVPVVYTAKNHFNYTDPDSDVYPVKLLLINPKVVPEYGTNYKIIGDSVTHKGFDDLLVSLGGGRERGNDNAHWMHEAENIDLSTHANKLWFDGAAQGDTITRYFSVEIDNKTVGFKTVTISHLPTGVIIPKGIDPNLDVKPLSSGSYQITVKGSAMGQVEIPIQYPVGFDKGEVVSPSVTIFYEGVQSKTGNLVQGSNIVYFDFKPVHSSNDISNYNQFNHYTFSTLRDPLILRFSNGDDVIKGGKGDYTYYANGGNDKAYGSTTLGVKETFHLGAGDNEFYANIANDTVDTDNANANNRLYLSDAINNADSGSTVTTIMGGGVSFSGTKGGVGFHSTMKNFSNILFETGDNNQKTERNDILNIDSTWNLPSNIIADLGAGYNEVRATNSAITVNFKAPTGDTVKLPFITTDNTRLGVYIKWQGNNNKIIGSKGDDTLIGSNDNQGVYFDGAEGVNTANYGEVTVELTYEASKGTVSKGGGNTDTVVRIQNLIGGAGNNNFYGALYTIDSSGNQFAADIKYTGNGAKTTLSYEKLKVESNNGVVIDLANKTVTKNKTGGIDYFQNIGKITASNNDDTIIVAANGSNNNLDGLLGFNTIDYSKLSVGVEITLSPGSSSTIGTVRKGGGAQGMDSINNFRHFIGSSIGSVFTLNNYSPVDAGAQNRFFIEGRGSNETANSVIYNNLDEKAIHLDMRLGNDGFLATIYKGNNSSSGVIGVDKIKNVGVFKLTGSAENIIYMYDVNQLGYTIDAGDNSTNNQISFEHSKVGVSLDFRSTDYSTNITHVNKLILTKQNDNVIMGSGFFAGTIDGNEGVNKIDFSTLTSKIDAKLDLANINITDVNINSKKINAINFEQIIATSSDDIFVIKFDLKQLGNIKDKNIFLDGSQGINELNFKEVEASSDGAGLTIDLSGGNQSVVTDSKTNTHIMNFLNFSKIIGSKGNDVFILPNVAFNFTIDGFTHGDNASNAVSYQQYNGVNITEATLSKFLNIQKIIGSKGNDIVTLNSGTSLQVDGFGGFDAAHYNGVISTVIVNVNNDRLEIIKNDGKKDILSKIEYINFLQTSGNQSITYNIKSQDNASISADGRMFFTGGGDVSKANSYVVNYKELSVGVTLNLKVEAGKPAQGSWISVHKAGNGIDYLQNIGKIQLSDKDNTVNVDNSIADLPNIKDLHIDGGTGHNTLSFATYVGNVNIDVNISQMTFREVRVTFVNFSQFVGSSSPNANSIFKSNDSKTYDFDGLYSNSTLSYEKITTGHLVVDIAAGSGSSYNELSITKPSSSKDTARNIVNIVGSGGQNTINIKAELSKNMTFSATSDGNNNFISYDGVINTGILTFNVTKDGILANKVNGLFSDKIGGFYNLKGSSGDNRFEINDDIAKGSIKYNFDGNKGFNTINFGHINSDINFTLSAGSNKISVGAGSSTSFVDFANMHAIYGSSAKTNNFILGDFFNKHYMSSGILTIYGNSAQGITNKLDLSSSSGNITLDPLTGKISLRDDNTAPQLVTASGIQTIILGSGASTIDISSGSSSVGWTFIDGTKGHNNIVSFERMFSGITYDLVHGVVGGNGASNITLKNFTGIKGTKGNDTFQLAETYQGSDARAIDGGGGTRDTLDYSKLSVHMTVDIPQHKVTRGTIVDSVTSIQVFKSGKGGADFISEAAHSYSFQGLSESAASNTLSYQGVNVDLVFSFSSSTVAKANGSDTFKNISKFTGGSKNNNFIFTTDNIATGLQEITLTGGGGTTNKNNNIINLSQLSEGITYHIDNNYFEVKLSDGTNLKVHLENMGQLIGTSKADKFIFGDNTDGFFANGGNNASGVKDTIDFSAVNSGVTVDFTSKIITFNGKSNRFLNIDIFVGSTKGNNIFKGLDNTSSYVIDGAGGDNNTLDYNAASSSLKLSIINNNIVINKGSISDTFKNIQILKLSNLDDTVVFQKNTDLTAYGKFKSIDGGLGDNIISFQDEVMNGDITIDFNTNKISIGTTVNQELALKNFDSYLFADGAKNYTVIAAAGNLNIKNVVFGQKDTTSGILTLDAITEDLTVMVDNTGKNVDIVGAYSGNRGKVVHLKTLSLGNKTYNIQYAVYNPSSPLLDVKSTTGTVNIAISEYRGTTSNITIGTQDSKYSVSLDTHQFSNINTLNIAQATKAVNLSLTALVASNFNLHLNNTSITGSSVNFTINTGNGSATGNYITLGDQGVISVGSSATSSAFLGSIFTNAGNLTIQKASTLVISSFTSSFKNVDAKQLTANEDLVLDLGQLGISSAGITIDIGEASNKYEIKESNKTFITINTGALNKNIIGSNNNDTFVIHGINVAGRIDGGKGSNTISLNGDMSSATSDRATINQNSLSITGNVFHINLTLASINVINFGASSSMVNLGQIEVEVYTSLSKIDFGRTNNDSRHASISFKTNAINNINGTVDISGGSYISGSFYYAGGNFNFNNLNAANSGQPGPSAVSNIYLADASVRDVINFNTSSAGDLTTIFEFNRTFKIGYSVAHKNQSLVDFSGTKIGAKSMNINLVYDSTAQDGGMLFQEAGKDRGGFYFFGIPNVNLNLTDASDDSKKFKITVDKDFKTSSGTFKLTLGDMNLMQLPSNPNNGDGAGWGNDPDGYKTYNNQIIFKENAGGNLTGDLLLNVNNQSIFTMANNSKIDISGANLFWGPDSSVVTNFKIHQLSQAKPFVIALAGNKNNILDFSNVKDGLTYHWEAIYQSSTRDRGLIINITNATLDGNPGTKLYGTVIGAGSLILTGGNDEFIPTVSMQDKFNKIDGGDGLNNFTLATAGGGGRTLDFNKYPDGFDYYTTGGTTYGIDFVNFKVITGHDSGDRYRTTLSFKSEGALNTSTEHNFIVQRPTNSSGEALFDTKITADNVSSRAGLNLFFNKDYMFISGDANQGGNITFLAKDFSITDVNPNGGDIVLGPTLDFSNIKAGTNLTVNAAGSLNARLPDDTSNLNYTIQQSSNTITIHPNTNPSTTLTINAGRLTLYYLNNNEYYSYLLAHSKTYAIADRDSKLDPNSPSSSHYAKKIEGANYWDSKQQYLDHLNKTAASTDYWKQLDSRINDALDGKHDNARNKNSVNDDSNNKDNNTQNVNQQNEQNKDNQQNPNDININNISHEETDGNTNHSANIVINYNEANNGIKDSDSLKVLKEDLLINNKADLNLLDKFNKNEQQEKLSNNDKDHNSNKQQDDKVDHSEDKAKEINMIDGKTGDQTKLDGNDSSNSKDDKDSHANANELNNNASANSENGNHSAGNEFNLNAVLEAAKNSGSADSHNQNNIMEDFGLSNIPVDVLESTYKQDEANSMSYALDSNHTYADSYGNDHSSTSNSQEQQKAKVSH